MRITQDVAKTIVNEISNTINKNVNLMEKPEELLPAQLLTGLERFIGGHRKL